MLDYLYCIKYIVCVVVEEVEVVFCFGDKHLLVDEFKLVKDDIFQIGYYLWMPQKRLR